MNPDLDALWQNVVKAHAAAKAAGDSLAPSDIDEYLQSASKGKYGLKDIAGVNLRNLGRSFVQGATLNAAPALVSGEAKPADLAGLEAGGNAVMPGLGSAAALGRKAIGKVSALFGGNPQAGEDMKLRDELFNSEHPVASTVAGMAGGAVPFALAPEVKVGGLAANLAKSALIGGGTSAIAAANNAEDGHGLEAAGKAAIPGALFGAAVPAAVAGLKFLGKSGGVERVRNAINGMGGADAAKARALEFDQAGLGDQTTLGDLGDRLRSVSKYAVENNDNAAADRIGATMRRTAQAPQNLMDRARALLPQFGKDPNAPAIQARDTADLMQWAKGPEGYGGLRDANPEMPNTQLPTKASPEYQAAAADLEAAKKKGIGGKVLQMLEDKLKNTEGAPKTAEPSVLTQPKVRDALRHAQETGLIGKMPDLPENPSFEKLFQVKDLVDGLTGKAFASGDGTAGAKLKEAAGILDEHLAANVPGYDAVRGEYAQRSKLLRAFDTGHEMFKSGDSRQIADQLASMQPDELHNARLAMASDLVAKLRAPGAKTFARQLGMLGQTGASEGALSDKLGAIFGDKPTLNKYLQYANLVNEHGKMSSSYGGSQTYRNLMAGQADPMEIALDKAGAGLSTSGLPLLKSTAIRAASKMIAGPMRQENAAQAHNLLMRTGTSSILKTIDEVMKRSPLVGKYATQGVPAALSGLISRF